MSGAPRRDATGYLPIADYAAIGNLRTVVLVGLDGSIDWCCMPELQRPSVFAALLDARRGGHFRVAPRGLRRSRQRYLGNSWVLETRFEAEGGALVMVDFMPLRGSIVGAGDPDTAPEIHRVLTCTEGEVEVEVEWAPRFDYARAPTRVQRLHDRFVATAGGERLGLLGLPPGSAVVEEREDGPTLRAAFRLAAGERRALVTRFAATGEPHAAGPAEAPGPDLEGVLALMRETRRVWEAWADDNEEIPTGEWAGEWSPLVTRSELTLKLLTQPESGAVAAAATTSLPEIPGGSYNWDYRFCWIRDAVFVVQALYALGHRAEAYDFLHFIGRAAQRGETGRWSLQIMYGLDGETDLREFYLDHLEGYRGARPVRIGNAAACQSQHDTFGELMEAAADLVRRHEEIQEDVWSFLSHLADLAAEAWCHPDEGIWELRDRPRHYVYSKVMLWTALDRALELAHRRHLRGDVERWRHARRLVHDYVVRRGYRSELGSFVQSPGSRTLDAANLLIPVVGFLPAGDPRVQGTIDLSLRELTEDGLVFRYRRLGDDLPEEGAFGLCTFWMVDALALSHRLDEARELFDGMLRRANHVGLYAEQIDPRTGLFQGNFPQAFTHLGLINSALYLAYEEGRRVPYVPQIRAAERGSGIPSRRRGDRTPLSTPRRGGVSST